MEKKNLTPMLKQYFAIKKDYPDSILFFRMGDFYEMFFEDAKIAAPLLEVVLTSRDKNKKNAVPLCGIPYHARDIYAQKLLKRGYKVAVCEQVEDPARAKGIVRREVTRILTPATALELENGDDDLNSYVVSVYRDETHLALAAVDLAAGEFEVRAMKRNDWQGLVNEIFRKSPREFVLENEDGGIWDDLNDHSADFSHVMVSRLDHFEFNYIENSELLQKQLHVEGIEGLGLTDYPAAVIAAGVLLKYLGTVRKTALKNITGLRFSPEEKHLILDSVAFRNLEILKNLRDNSARGSLMQAVDMTVTPMGRRLLKKWLSYPLTDKKMIEQRLGGVEEMLANLIVRTEIRRLLKGSGDLAKLNSMVSLNIALPRHLQRLAEILKIIPEIKQLMESLYAEALQDIRGNLDPLFAVRELVESAIASDPPNVLNDGNYIRDGYSGELDDLRHISRDARSIIAGLEKRERERTGIQTLKIKFNRVFGYFIEVTKTHLALVPPEYVRKQTLVNAERYINSELKELEDKILRAQEKIIQLESSLYADLISRIQAHARALETNSIMLARLDVLAAGGELAQRRNYCRPHITANGSIDIKGGRHPVVESGSGLSFIPNDMLLDGNSNQILIITGPNMGGKSTYLRQNALIVLLAQAGYFVPADKARIGICDRIFTRIGASDSLMEGKSTFLIEMIETSIIVNNATSRSLILLDEIGRGTSTFDGLSIAWAVLEYLHGMNEKPRTLFATHYHELTELSQILGGVKNYHIAVREWQENVVFLHKVVEGATDQSFGIHVAKIAGIPAPVIERAKEVLLNLEKKELNRLVKERITGKISRLKPKNQSLFPENGELKLWDEIRKKLGEIDISAITPLEALNILHYLKSKSEKLD